MRNFLLGFILFSASLFSAHPICVRNFPEKDGINFCEKFSDVYAYVTPLKSDLHKPICTRMYESLFCKQSQTYEPVVSLNKGTICVLNDNQPPVANLCESLPELYAYIKESSED